MGIFEAYYDDLGVVHSLSTNPVCPTAASIEELRNTLELLVQALDKPVIPYDSIGGK